VPRSTVLLAVYELFGGVDTSLAAPAQAGDEALTVTAPLPARVQSVEVDVGGGVPEFVTVTSQSGSGPYTLGLGEALAYPHASGAIVGTFVTQQPAPVPLLRTLFRGQPMDPTESMMPLVVTSLPGYHEYRSGGLSRQPGMAQKKLIDHDVWIRVRAVLAGPAPTNGAVMLEQFYALLDQMGALIRTNKTLVTPSFPQGAALRFGEEYKAPEVHRRVEQQMELQADFHIPTTELVEA
jgi:hypothetical protein